MANLLLNRSSKVLLLFFIALVVWWVTIFIRGISETTENYLYSLIYGLIPLLWGFLGLRNSFYWGGFKSALGRSLGFLSLGTLAWAIGNLIWGYYNLILNVAVPYPGLADFGFGLSYPLWAVGIFFLSRVTGAVFSLRQAKGKMILFALPVIVIVVSYYFLFAIARGGVIDTEGGLLKLFLDVAYPIGDVINLTLALLVYWLSVNYLGGRFKWPIVTLLLGIGTMYIADFFFSYNTTLNTFFVGSWVDLVYTTSMFLIVLGVTSLNPRALTGEN